MRYERDGFCYVLPNYASFFFQQVTKDDVIVAEKLVGDIGTTLEIADVLLVGTRESTIVGRPTVPGATVKLFVEEQTRDKKVNIQRCGVWFKVHPKCALGGLGTCCEGDTLLGAINGVLVSCAV